VTETDRPDSGYLSQVVNQLHFDLPSADLLVLSNTKVTQNKLVLDEKMRGRIQVPTMYQSWTEPRKSHIQFEYLDKFTVLEKNPIKDLMIFDTWGTSSYYHLLIDHIVPLWITAEYLRAHYGILMGSVDYYRISNNGWPTELETAKDIFKYFFNTSFVETVDDQYKNVIYGYFYSYRPYHGPNEPRLLYPNYRNWLSKFREKYCNFENAQFESILVPYRNNRTFEHVDRFVQKYSNRIKFEHVDFGNLSIGEQIRISGRVRGMFGCEGAAFTNIIFMQQNSKVVPVAQDYNRFMFHQCLSDYIGHAFKGVHINPSGMPSLSDDDLLRFLEH
jgi:hypothetical protein